MRFARLSLERYGRFEGCELEFRAGSPDLHIVYGANEAGKTTSLAAVSDLLFGFPARSPYNFLFDYALLRVGAVLEDAGRTLACRRKKGTAGTLLDEADAAMDEALLRGMLKGQTRETFGLSFSLDQEALRSGGRAMVEARNDLGRTLFAAGSGLTAVADELKSLEAEADAIWGPTAKASRTYTQAQRQLAEAARLVKENALRPKAWTDARAAADDTFSILERARRERDAVEEELSGLERMRRIAPLARRREEALDALATHAATVELGRLREDAAEKLIGEAEAAVREAAMAEQLRADLGGRRDKVAADAAALTEAEAVDEMVVEEGAVAKAARDLVRLQAEHAAAVALVEVRRRDAGPNADAPPPLRVVSARLRELARFCGELQAEERHIAKARTTLGERRRRAEAELAKVPEDGAAEALTAALDAAKALGADVDGRVAQARDAANAASAQLQAALARLKPWQGQVEELVSLPVVGAAEAERARDNVADLIAEIRREEDGARRASEQVAAATLAINQVETGSAVSADDLAEARQAREATWSPIRDHVVAGAPLPRPEEAVQAFESSVTSADERADLRFALADASSRLSILQQRRSTHELEADQARARAEALSKRHSEVLAGWQARLVQAGLPAMDPAAFITWQAERASAEEVAREAGRLATEADRWAARRDGARSALFAALSVADGGGEIAPVLGIADRRQAALDEALKARLLARSELDRIDEDAADLDARARRLASDLEEGARAWREAIGRAGLEVEVATCGTVLDALDELREAVAAEAALKRRIGSIVRDEREHANRVGAIADRLGVAAGEPAARLAMLKARVSAARSAQAVLTGMTEEETALERRIGGARATLATAEAALTSVLAETGCADRTELTGAIERSRAVTALRTDLAAIERRIVEEGDGLSLDELVAACSATNAGEAAASASSLRSRLADLNAAVDAAATAHGEARKAFQSFDTGSTSAADAAAEAEQARAELEVLSEHFILKRAQAVMLKWAIERYRERHQDPLLLRAGELFAKLTTGRYASLKVDSEGSSPRLLGLRDDGRTVVEVGAMSEGTTDQLFLALRLAALERSVAAGVALPFLADDLFVNFDDDRARAGFEVLADVARTTQVLFFTHHPHLVAIAKSVVGAQLHSECALQ
ncbi:AAA family ATPase [Sphingomonas sp. HHU CXW]|uniref:AAA family ATPase n=1 Tax=Sphingomonas hominis TaxID=2741495 RepID=A0ABX2JPX3_9SPHN|nr:YhaN family protein [Sphingomonas hominis]NTS66497.1 AAA family ATPase [Sphingomonas hominis]